jgi:predicted nicotinamide N-methyase
MSNMPKRRPHPTAMAFFDALDQHISSSSSDFIRHKTQSLGWRGRYSQADHYPVTVGENHFYVRQIQRGEVEGTYGTGATVWPASMVLLKYLERHPDIVANKTVVDLGGGTGVTSIAASLLGAKNVVCTDGIEAVVRLAEQNIIDAKVNRTQVCNYWWGSGTLQPQTFDTILVSDCVLPKLYPIAPLVEAILELLDNKGVAILSYEHRHFADFHPAEKFQELSREKGLRVHVVDKSRLDPIYSVDDIEVWEISKGCSE